MKKDSNHIAYCLLWVLVAQCVCICGDALASAAIVVDHRCVDIRQIPTNWVNQAKQRLHIAYGHTSHGSQLVDGMSGLIGFMNGHGYPSNLFAWNSGGLDSALDLTDMAFGGWYDLGDPDRTFWEARTRSYLATNSLCNVVIWAWCGQVSTATEEDINSYLDLMDGLQRDFTNVTFVHMTGHLDGWGPEGNLNMRNNQLRNHCLEHGDVLYDFADIESYDPDGITNYMSLYSNAECWYGPTGSQNWAIDWQNSHIEGMDWYDCTSWHTQPLNGNLKAYAAWWLWARLTGWPGISTAATAAAASTSSR
jgi:hypothetical protein